MGIMSSELNQNKQGLGGGDSTYSTYGDSIRITSKDISLMMYLLGQDATVDSEVLCTKTHNINYNRCNTLPRS